MTTIFVPDMMCENCVKRITNALTEAELKFTVSLPDKTVTIDSPDNTAPESQRWYPRKNGDPHLPSLKEAHHCGKNAYFKQPERLTLFHGWHPSFL